MSETGNCTAPQCDRDVWAKGLCSSHYAQQRKGLILKPLRPRRNRNMSAEEIGQWISEQVEIDSASGCWIWPLALSQKGYGVLSFQGKRWYVHRLMFSIFVGPLADGLALDHIECVSRACCNPAHLRQVSQAGNTQNQRGPRANNTSGHVGVYWSRRHEKWYAQITVGGTTTYLGRFTNLDDAIAAREEAERKYHPYRDPEYREPVAS